jgi:hypothetical protein
LSAIEPVYPVTILDGAEPMGNYDHRFFAVQIADWPSLNAIVESGLASGDRVVITPAETSPSARVSESVLPPASVQGP